MMESYSQRRERLRLAHEFNNELAIILSSCELLESTLDHNANAIKQIAVIKETARRVASTLSTISPGLDNE